ncbi:MAG TPA: LPXTG cell wall anchor domain-containing protein [Candidatus Limnocylindria bacterium]
MRTLSLVIAGLAILAGGTFFLQGIGVLPGSYMTGDPTWAWIGGALVIGGLGLIVWSRRRAAV